MPAAGRQTAAEMAAVMAAAEAEVAEVGGAGRLAPAQAMATSDSQPGGKGHLILLIIFLLGLLPPHHHRLLLRLRATAAQHVAVLL